MGDMCSRAVNYNYFIIDSFADYSLTINGSIVYSTECLG